MDALSEMLRMVRLTGGIFMDARFTSPWCITANMDADDCRPFLENPTQLIAYHYIISGRLILSVAGAAPIEINAGEIVLFPRNDGHIMASAPGIAPVRAGTLVQPSADSAISQIRYGGGGAATHLVCGFLGTSEGFNPLIEALPQVLVLDVRQSLSRDWIEASVKYAAAELAMGRLASSGVILRVSETLFVEAVRQYAENSAETDTGWLQGLRDPQVGRALALIHRDIGAPCSVAALAKEAAMSRSAFVERFTAIVGVPPMRYIARWRLQTARRSLRETPMPIAQLAHSVGYESEEAFSRAFKREFGVSPARWRDHGKAA